MGLEIEGKLVKKLDTIDVNATFKKREFVIETDEKYPQMIKFELVQERCSLIDDIAEGDFVKVEFNLKGREWNEKYFTNLHAWRINKVGEGSAQSSGGGTNKGEKVDNTNIDDSADDDLPF